MPGARFAPPQATLYADAITDEANVTDPGVAAPSASRSGPTGDPAVEAALSRAQAEIATLRRREASYEAQIKQLTQALETAEQELADVPGLRDELEAARDSAHWLEVTQSSLSWRVTRPLRWLTGLVRRGPGRRPPAP
jgi:Zn-dependent oligopeptidase